MYFENPCNYKNKLKIISDKLTNKKEEEEIKQKPIGLININFDCYVNSIIQLLFHITKFREYFINEVFSQIEQPISYELSKIFKKINNGNKGKSFHILNFKNMMGKYDDIFLDSNGADAVDLLRYIFSIISTECIKDNNNINIEEEILDESNENLVYKEIQKISNQSIINNIFYFYNKTTYLCKNNHVTYSFDYSCLLEFDVLDIYKKLKKKYGKAINKISLNDCFIFNKITLNNNELFCSKCQKNSICNSVINLYSTRDYLILIINNNFLNIKLIYDEYINIDEFVEKNNKEYFRLIGAVMHYGNSNFNGHFISYCRYYINDKFYKINDLKVTETNFENILKDSTPYILCYEKIYNKSYKYIHYERNPKGIILFSIPNNIIIVFMKLLLFITLLILLEFIIYSKN